MGVGCLGMRAALHALVLVASAFAMPVAAGPVEDLRDMLPSTLVPNGPCKSDATSCANCTPDESGRHFSCHYYVSTGSYGGICVAVWGNQSTEPPGRGDGHAGGCW